MKLKLRYIVLAAGVIPAMEAGSVPYVGLELFASSSTGTLKNSFPSSGSGIGLFVDGFSNNGFGYSWDINCNTTFTDRKLTISGGSTASAKFSNYGTLLIGRYHPSKRNTGFYVMAGIGARRFQGIINFPAGTPPPLPKSNFGDDAMSTYYACDTGIKLSYMTGMGYDFNTRWGALVRYQGISSLGHTLATVESGITFRF